MVDIEIVGIHCSIFSRGPYTYKTHLWTPFKPVKTIPDLKWTETSWFRSNDFGLASTRCGWMPSRFTCVSQRRPKGATCDMQKIAPVCGELGTWTLNVLRWCTIHVYILYICTKYTQLNKHRPRNWENQLWGLMFIFQKRLLQEQKTEQFPSLT